MVGVVVVVTYWRQLIECNGWLADWLLVSLKVCVFSARDNGRQFGARVKTNGAHNRAKILLVCLLPLANGNATALNQDRAHH